MINSTGGMTNWWYIYLYVHIYLYIYMYVYILIQPVKHSVESELQQHIRTGGSGNILRLARNPASWVTHAWLGNRWPWGNLLWTYLVDLPPGKVSFQRHLAESNRYKTFYLYQYVEGLDVVVSQVYRTDIMPRGWRTCVPTSAHAYTICHPDQH